MLSVKYLRPNCTGGRIKFNNYNMYLVRYYGVIMNANTLD